MSEREELIAEGITSAKLRVNQPDNPWGIKPNEPDVEAARRRVDVAVTEVMYAPQGSRNVAFDVYSVLQDAYAAAIATAAEHKGRIEALRDAEALEGDYDALAALIRDAELGGAK